MSPSVPTNGPSSPGASAPRTPRVVRAPFEISEAAAKGIWIVIAAFQEADMVGRVVSELRETFPNVVVVDDGSRDDTGACARKAGATVLRHPINRGQGAALQTGIHYALRRGAEIVATFDADGQHDVRDLPHLVRPVIEGEADFALGSRFLPGSQADVPRARRMLLAAAVGFTWFASGLRLTDAHNGMRAFSRRAAMQIDLRLDRMAHASEWIDQMRHSGLPFVEVPVRVRYTEYSRNKGQRGRDAFKVLADYVFGRLLS